MADTEEKKGKKPDKQDQPKRAAKPEVEGKARAAKAEKGDKGEKGARAGKPAEKAEADSSGEPAAPAIEERVPPRLKLQFEQTISAKLTEQFGYKNRMQVPHLDKVVINMGIGEAVADRKKVESAAADLALIAGQKAVVTKARKSIATYKVRAGQPIGCKVTLRKARMYEFLDRLINVALPRVRDFRGLSAKSFDGRGNYSLGIREHIVFPEIDYDKATDIWGMDITVCTTARSDDEARALLAACNFPFRQ